MGKVVKLIDVWDARLKRFEKTFPQLKERAERIKKLVEIIKEKEKK